MVRWKENVSSIVIISILLLLPNSISIRNIQELQHPLLNEELNELEDYNQILFTETFNGSHIEELTAITTDEYGNLYVLGWTMSGDFPTKNALDSTLDGWGDVVLVKMSPSGEILTSTFIGGSGGEYSVDISINSQGMVVLLGITFSSDFPVINAYSNSISGLYAADIFIMLLNSDCNEIITSTYFGGSSYDEPIAMILDSEDNLIITGMTESHNFPLKNPFIQSYSGGESDPFIFKMNPNVSELIYSSYLGGLGYYIMDLTIDSFDNTFVLGRCYPEPVYSTYATSVTADVEWNRYPVIFKIDKDGSFEYTISLDTQYYYTTSMTIDSEDKIYVTGIIPRTPRPDSDGYIIKLNSDTGDLEFTHIFGGSSFDIPSHIETDRFGNVFVVGLTSSSDFPIIFSDTLPPNNSNICSFLYSVDSEGDTGFVSMCINTKYEKDWPLDFTLSVDDNRLTITGVNTEFINGHYEPHGFISSISLYSKNDPPLVNHPPDLSLLEGNINTTLTWTVYCFRNLSYTIYLDNQTIYQGLFNGPNSEEISVNLINLRVGSHKCRLVLDDYSGTLVSDEIQIDVDPRPLNELVIPITATVSMVALVALMIFVLIKREDSSSV